MFVTIVGSFETWSNMDYFCRRIAGKGHSVLTSRYVYLMEPVKGKVIRYAHNPVPGESLEDFLRDSLVDFIGTVGGFAIVVLTIPGAHYNELQWLEEAKIPTLGIALVRNVKGTGRNCEYLRTSAGGLFSFCSAKPPINGFFCSLASSCPFKRREISKNILEKFIRNHKFFRLVAIEDLTQADEIIDKFLIGTLEVPPTRYQYEVRFPVLDKIALAKRLKEIGAYICDEHSCIDYYYRPDIFLNDDDWERERVRIREWLPPHIFPGFSKILLTSTEEANGRGTTIRAKKSIFKEGKIELMEGLREPRREISGGRGMIERVLGEQGLKMTQFRQVAKKGVSYELELGSEHSPPVRIVVEAIKSGNFAGTWAEIEIEADKDDEACFEIEKIVRLLGIGLNTITAKSMIDIIMEAGK